MDFFLYGFVDSILRGSEGMFVHLWDKKSQECEEKEKTMDNSIIRLY